MADEIGLISHAVGALLMLDSPNHGWPLSGRLGRAQRGPPAKAAGEVATDSQVANEPASGFSTGPWLECAMGVIQAGENRLREG